MTSPSESAKPRKMSCRETVDYLRAHYLTGDPPRLKYQYRSVQWELDGNPTKEYKLVRLLRCGSEELATHNIEAALTELEVQEEAAVRARIMQLAMDLGAQPGQEDDSELRRLLAAFTGPNQEPRLAEANLWMMKQWLWQVLRGCMQERRSYEVMIIFHSERQATFKSGLIERLTEPFAEVTRHQVRVHNLTDQFYTQLLGRCCIAVLDEFVGPSRSEDVAHIKSLITSPTLMARVPHSDQGCEVDNRLSLIGSSNLPPPHQLNDKGGSRRIWSIHGSEIPILSDPDRAALIETLDMRKVYRAVDWRVPRFFNTIPAEVRTTIDHMQRDVWKPADLLESWLAERTVPVDGAKVSTTDLIRSLKDYARAHNFDTPRYLNKKTVKAMLAPLGVQVTTTSGEYLMRNRRLVSDGQVTLPEGRPLRLVGAEKS